MRVAWMFRWWKYIQSRLGSLREPQNRVSGLAVSEPTWNFQIRKWPENNLRGITLGTRPVWRTCSLIFPSLLVVWCYTFPCSRDFPALLVYRAHHDNSQQCCSFAVPQEICSTDVRQTMCEDIHNSCDTWGGTTTYPAEETSKPCRPSANKRENCRFFRF